MNEIIENKPTPEFSPQYLQWLYTLTILVLIFVFFTLPLLKSSYRLQTSMIGPPHLIAAGQTVEFGIMEFQSGKTDPVPQDKEHGALLSLIVLFILSPTIVLFYLKRSKSENVPAAAPVGIKRGAETFLFIISLALVFMLVIGTAAGTYISPRVFETMKTDNQHSYERDLLTNDLVDAYVAIMLYYWQTEQYGGTNNKIFAKDPAGAIRAVQSLNELNVKEKGEYGTKYLEPISSDTLIILYSIGTSGGAEKIFKNYNGDHGKMQYTLTIRPNVHTYNIQQNN